jgi:tetratricopeptide (TPR) repeat protein
VADTSEADDLCERAGELAQSGRSSDAIPLMSKAVEAYAKALGEAHGTVAEALGELGALHVDVGDLAGARTVYERLLRVREALHVSAHPEVGRAHHHLAEVHRAARAYDEAQRHAERCLEIWTAAYAKDSPDEIYVASALNNLAAIEAKRGAHARASILYARAIELEERLGGPENPALATVLNNFANVLITQDKLDLAEQMLERALKLVEDAYGKDHADASLVLHSMGHLHASKRDWAKAEELLRRALAIEDGIEGREPPTKAALLAYLGEVCRKNDKKDDAARFLERALTIYERVYGKDHAKVASTREAIARVKAP